SFGFFSFCFSFFLSRRPPTSPLFPYTTLFRSRRRFPWTPASAGVTIVGCPAHLAAPSQRDVVVLLPGVGELFAAQHRKRAAQPPPGAARQDHVVDKAAARRDEGVGEFLAVFIGPHLDRRAIAEIGPENDLDGALRPHHRDLG